MRSTHKPLAVISLLALALAGSTTAAPLSIWETIVLNPQLTSLVDALNGTALVAPLNSTTSNFTLFAPTNPAFAALGDVNVTLDALKFHASEDVFDITSGGNVFATTLLTDPDKVKLGGKGQVVEVSNSTVTFIVFVNNSVTQKMTATIGSVVPASNGQVIVIDAVLQFPVNETSSLISGQGRLSTLLSLVADAGLATDANTVPGLTIFAPDNTAFSALPPFLTADVVKTVLELHLVTKPEVFYSSDLAMMDNMTVETLAGAFLKIDTSGGIVRVGGAKVEDPDFVTPNGVFHVMADVILPNATFIEDNFNIFQAGQLLGLSAILNLINSTNYAPVKAALTAAAPKKSAFLPTDAAVTAANINASDVMAVTHVLQYHVSSSVMPTDGLAFLPSLLTDPDLVQLGGKPQVLKVMTGATTTKVNDVAVISSAKCTNGDVMSIGTVLTIPKNIVPTAQAANLTKLLEAVEAVNLTDAVQGPSLTILAPTNAAFEAFANKFPNVQLDLLAFTLELHVIPSVVYSTGLTNGQEITTLAGAKLLVQISNGTDPVVTIGGAKVVLPDVLVSNGVVHVLDSVIAPNASDVSALEAAQLDPQLKDFADLIETDASYSAVKELLNSPAKKTVFAPNNAAAAGINSSDVTATTMVLQYHTAEVTLGVSATQFLPTALKGPDSVVKLNGKGQVVQVDLGPNNTVAVNGVAATGRASVKNGVLLTAAALLTPPANLSDILQDNNASALWDAIKSQDLEDAVAAGEVTIFAPNNAVLSAFVNAKKPSPEELKKVLQYHVFVPPNVPSVLYSTVLAQDVGQSIESVNGFESKVTTKDGGLFIGKAQVTVPNLLTSNGVVHIIDAVITEPTAASGGSPSSKKLKWWGIILIILAIFLVLFAGWKLYQRSQGGRKQNISLGTSYQAVEEHV